MRRFWRRAAAGAASSMFWLGCGGSDSGPTGTGHGNVTLETGQAVSDSIGPSGGTLTTTSSSGVHYSVTFPAGALKDPVEITMTPIDAIKSLNVTTLAGGVAFEPSGLVLGSPATLTITNAGSAGAGLTAIGFNSDNEADSLAADLVAESGGVFTLRVRHFSLSGLAFATLGQIQAFSPTAGSTNPTTQLFVDSLFNLVIESPRDFAGEISTMRAWFTTVILPQMQAAGTDVQLLFAVSEYNYWREMTTPANLIVDDPLFATERDQFAEAALPKLQQAVVDNNAECRSTHGLGFVNNVLFWQTVAGDLDLDSPANGLDRQSILNGLCVSIDFLNVSYPDPPTVGQPHSLDVEAELRFSDGEHLVEPLSFDVTLVGAQQAGPITGLSDALGNFTAVVTPAQSSLTISIKTCLFTAEVPYADICGVSNLSFGANDLDGTWTGVFDEGGGAFPARVVLNQNQNAVSGPYTDDVQGLFGGTVTATLSEASLLNFSLNQTSPCVGVYSNDVSIAHGEISGLLSGSDCSATTSVGIRLARTDSPPLSGFYRHDPNTATDVTVIQLADTLFFPMGGQGLYRAIVSGGTFSGGAAGPNPHCIAGGTCGLNLTIPISGTINGTTISGSLANQFPPGSGTFTFSATRP